MPAPLREIAIRIPPDYEEATTAALEQHLAIPCSILTRPGDPCVEIRAYPKAGPSGTARLKADLLQTLARVDAILPNAARIRIRLLPATSWASAWKRHFPVIEIGHRLQLRPTWSRRRARPGQAVVILDPGLSFGTGHHPTTRFCLEHLVRRSARADHPSLLDLGTGSGILSIAGAKLGYRPVIALDSDPQAVQVARRNIRRNRLGGRVRVVVGDAIAWGVGRRVRFDVVVANLTADLLIGLAKRLRRLLVPGGTLLAAGILKVEFEGVRKAFEVAGLELRQGRTEGEWRSGRFDNPG